MVAGAEQLSDYHAFVLSGGFAYEDRIRAGAVAAHDRMMDFVVAASAAGKLVLGICNGAQDTWSARTRSWNRSRRAGRLRPRSRKNAAPAPHFVTCRHVYLKLGVIEPSRCADHRGVAAGGARFPHGRHIVEGYGSPPRKRTSHRDLRRRRPSRIRSTRTATGRVDVDAVPNGSALGCAGLVNRAGNVLAIMPHPERDAWNFNHLDRREGEDVLAPSGGAVLFRSFVDAVGRSAA